MPKGKPAPRDDKPTSYPYEVWTLSDDEEGKLEDLVKEAAIEAIKEAFCDGKKHDELNKFFREAMKKAVEDAVVGAVGEEIFADLRLSNDGRACVVVNWFMRDGAARWEIDLIELAEGLEMDIEAAGQDRNESVLGNLGTVVSGLRGLADKLDAMIAEARNKKGAR